MDILCEIVIIVMLNKSNFRFLFESVNVNKYTSLDFIGIYRISSDFIAFHRKSGIYFLYSEYLDNFGKKNQSIVGISGEFQ